MSACGGSRLPPERGRPRPTSTAGRRRSSTSWPAGACRGRRARPRPWRRETASSTPRGVARIPCTPASEGLDVLAFGPREARRGAGAAAAGALAARQPGCRLRTGDDRRGPDSVHPRGRAGTAGASARAGRASAHDRQPGRRAAGSADPSAGPARPPKSGSRRGLCRTPACSTSRSRRARSPPPSTATRWRRRSS